MEEFFIPVILLIVFSGVNNLNAQLKQSNFEFGSGGTGGWEKVSSGTVYSL